MPKTSLDYLTDRIRNASGSVLTEFIGTMTAFILFLLMPLINFTAIPIRYLMAYGEVSEFTRKLSLSENRSQAVMMATDSDNYQNLVNKLGMTVSSCDISIVCKDKNNQSKIFSGKSAISDEWLPGGARGQCDYFLQSEINMEIPPWVCLKPNIAGISGPLKVTFTNIASWENLGRDPGTQQFYINE